MFTSIMSPDQALWNELAKELQRELRNIGWRKGSGKTFIRYAGDPRKYLISKGEM